MEPILGGRVEVKGEGGLRPQAADFVTGLFEVTPDSGGAASSNEQQPKRPPRASIDESDDEFNISEPEWEEAPSHNGDGQQFNDDPNPLPTVANKKAPRSEDSAD